jgi:hypothetical protein
MRVSLRHQALERIGPLLQRCAAPLHIIELIGNRYGGATWSRQSAAGRGSTKATTTPIQTHGAGHIRHRLAGQDERP